MRVTLNGGYSYRETLGHKAGGLSLLAYLGRRYTHSDAATWQARLVAGELQLDGQTVTQDVVLRTGQQLVWHRPPWREPAAPLNVEVLAERAGLLAVNKPSGLPTLPGAGFLEHTLLHQVRLQYPEATPLHRLGRGTSGLVLFALAGDPAQAVLQQWRTGAVQKRYLALVAGQPPQDEYHIHTPIGPVPHPLLGQVWAASEGGKAAHSVARVVQRRARSTLLEVDISTGRPHQIRIHLASLGYPLLGDPLYLPGGLPSDDAVPGDLGYCLHSAWLRLWHPRQQAFWEIQAPRPDWAE